MSGQSPVRQGELVLIDLADAEPSTSGGKAAVLARLLGAGLPVPPGFVVPTAAYEAAVAGLDLAEPGAARRRIGELPLAPALVEAISRALARLRHESVAVRSSASGEDTADGTAAGQHDTFLGVSGPEQVAGAVGGCWASLWSERAVGYRRWLATHGPDRSPTMAVLVQRLVDADVAGVLFTGAEVRIEASWGLGESVVGGRVTPDSWTVHGDTVLRRVLGGKANRLDRVRSRVVARAVPLADQERFCLTDEQLGRLVALGRDTADLLGGPQDIEWAIADGRIWLLQARPVTAPPPDAPAAHPGQPRHGRSPAVGTSVLTGTPGSPGIAVGPARVVGGPGDFARVRAGDVLVCRTTDPAWTPLFGVVAAVVTETGGVLSHAAIVAREQGLPAVLSVPGAMAALPDGATVEVDGGTGRVTSA
ncbi:PEP/pyruvate-binding domain-containing protein [Micromonospora sp. WMMD1102]|uniref:PEP/pyruvate-binding domain-containing protein n=1 Tax=Micromonospora sp. WMMD1102 TaxID=3016105 RepID=UPI002415058C|nr:PEP/pyruvate-binding domain-containing protein [Micromonospora sp. WMMD1102]MDG4785745.1 PEP/pyruvate-binding domain-containing protein [Micromonospora sp. WMMD1102]